MIINIKKILILANFAAAKASAKRAGQSIKFAATVAATVAKFATKFAAVAVFALAGCAGVDYSNMRINEDFTAAKTGEKIPLEELAARLAHERIIIIGERHDDARDHAMQARLLAALPHEIIYFEALSNDGTLAPGWDKSLYLPLFEQLRAAGKSLRGCALSESERAIIFAGAEPLAGRASTAPAVREGLARAIKQTHGSMDERTLAVLVAMQQHKDRRWADCLAHAGGPAVLVAGNFHASRALGVPLHLADFAAAKLSGRLQKSPASGGVNAPQTAPAPTPSPTPTTPTTAQTAVIISAEQNAQISDLKGDYLWIKN